jgi:hypothetical protein
MPASTAKFRILGIDHAAIQKDVAGTLTEYDMHFINNVTFDVQQQDVAFEGDNQTVRKFFMNGITATAACDTYDLAAISNAFGKTEVTAGVPDGVDGRTYFGDSVETAGVKCGLVAQVYAENLTTQLIETLRFVLPICVLTVVRPPTLAFNSKGVLSMTFTAEKADADISGDPLPSVPSGGAFWYVDRIAP